MTRKEEGRWVIVKDNDGHHYAIPEGRIAEFWQWVAWQEERNDKYDGADYVQCMLNRHLSSYVFVGKIEEPE